MARGQEPTKPKLESETITSSFIRSHNTAYGYIACIAVRAIKCVRSVRGKTRLERLDKTYVLTLTKSTTYHALKS